MESMEARAFGLGADARLAGKALGESPYREIDHKLAFAWSQGWWEVEAYYGRLVCGRWKVAKLRPIEAAPHHTNGCQQAGPPITEAVCERIRRTIGLAS